jgi:hypothetical protein
MVHLIPTLHNMSFKVGSLLNFQYDYWLKDYKKSNPLREMLVRTVRSSSPVQMSNYFIEDLEKLENFQVSISGIAVSNLDSC